MESKGREWVLAIFAKLVLVFLIRLVILYITILKFYLGASLVAQWLGIRLPMQGTRVRAPVREDPTCHRAARPVSHNYWACVSRACAPQRERPRQWKACAPRWRVAPARRNWRKPSHRNEDPTQPKINKYIYLKQKKNFTSRKRWGSLVSTHVPRTISLNATTYFLFVEYFYIQDLMLSFFFKFFLNLILFFIQQVLISYPFYTYQGIYVNPNRPPTSCHLMIPAWPWPTQG